MNTDAILITGVRVVDPGTGRDEIGELYIADGMIAEVPRSLPKDVRVIRGGGLTAVPGLLDMHVHLREPGREDAETIQSGTAAAARGGFTRVMAMANTQPAVDTPARVEWILRRAAEMGAVEVLTAAAITRGRRGEDLTDFAGLVKAGAAAFSDDGCTVADEEIMRAAMARAAGLGRAILDHAEDENLKGGGVMHAGAKARAAGLPGVGEEVETRIVARDIRLARETGCRLHIQHVSCGASISMISAAQEEGLPVSAEVTPHHLALCDEDVDPRDASYKVNPPLRSAEDRAALREAVAGGVVAAFASDHAPHTAASKARGFLKAPAGICGLETAVGVTYTVMVRGGLMDLKSWIERWTLGPARILGLPAPALEPGARADVTLLDLEHSWRVDSAEFVSRGRNTPFEGRKLFGRCVMTIAAGDIRYSGLRGVSER